MLAVTASPVALVTLGAFMRGIFHWRLAPWALVATGLKLLALPIFVYMVGTTAELDAMVVAASVLAAAMPTAVTTFVIAERYNTAPELVATTLVMSTVLSLLSISMLLLVLL